MARYGIQSNELIWIERRDRRWHWMLYAERGPLAQSAATFDTQRECLSSVERFTQTVGYPVMWSMVCS